MQATNTPTVTKEIIYNPQDHDYAAWICFEDGSKEYIGSRPTQYDASLLASDYIIQWYGDHHTPEAAARLIREELEQEGRHEQLARDMGGEWMDGGDPEAAHEWTPEYLLSLLTKEAECAICHTQQQCFNAGESGYICERCAALMAPWECPDCARLSHMCPGCTQKAKGGTPANPICTVHGCTNPATKEGLIPGLPVCDTCEPISYERLRRAVFGTALVEG